MLKLFIDILLFIIIAYYCYRFFQVLFRLNHHVLFPLTEQDLNEVRPQPESKLDYPNFSSHKFHILFHGGAARICHCSLFLGIIFERNQLVTIPYFAAAGNERERCVQLICLCGRRGYFRISVCAVGKNNVIRICSD